MRFYTNAQMDDMLRGRTVGQFNGQTGEGSAQTDLRCDTVAVFLASLQICLALPGETRMIV